MFDKADALLAPEDTSKSPEITALAISGIGKTEQKVPESAEKVITQAQTRSIFFAAFEIDSVMTYEMGIRERDTFAFLIGCFSLFLSGLNIIPAITADKTMLAYMAIPISFEESIEAPTPPMTNGAEGRFINVRRYSNSLLDISPLSNISAAESAPTG